MRASAARADVLEFIKVGRAFLIMRVIDQLIHQLVSQTLDVHCPAGCKMQNGLFPLGRTEQSAGASGHALHQANVPPSTPHTGQWEGITNGLACGRAFFFLYSDHFGNDVTCSPHDHAISDHYILAPDLILVVQRCIGDGYPAYEYRLQTRNRR